MFPKFVPYTLNLQNLGCLRQYQQGWLLFRLMFSPLDGKDHLFIMLFDDFVTERMSYTSLSRMMISLIQAAKKDELDSSSDVDLGAALWGEQSRKIIGMKLSLVSTHCFRCRKLEVHKFRTYVSLWGTSYWFCHRNTKVGKWVSSMFPTVM